jgi:hypothetical protein
VISVEVETHLAEDRHMASISVTYMLDDTTDASQAALAVSLARQQMIQAEQLVAVWRASCPDNTESITTTD